MKSIWLAVLGIVIVIIAIAADWLGLGSRQGFGEKQLMLAAVGTLMILAALEMYTGWFRERPPKTQWRILVCCIILLGAFIRVVHLVFVGFDLPFRYGGLFLEFAEQIVGNGYRMPVRIPFYTDGGIPFAYPPLPFYLEAILLDVFSLPKFLVVNLLPPLVAVLTLPLFHLLTRAMGLEPETRLAALVAYATMPATFRDLIEGAGLAEAFGSLALIGFAISLVWACGQNTVGRYMGVGALWAMCIVSSPGSAYASIPMILIFAIARLAQRPLQPKLIFRTGSFLGVATLIALAASSPYWFTVISNHGLGVFVNTLIDQNVENRWSFSWVLGHLLSFSVSGAPYPFLWDVIIFGGAIWALFARRWALLMWFLVFFCIPREYEWLVGLPAALLAGFSATKMFGPRFIDLSRSYLHRQEKYLVAGGGAILLAIYLLWNAALTIQGTVIGNGSVRGVAPGDYALTSDSIAAMEWIRENTPIESKFIVLSRPQVQEWTPQIARRTVLNMQFGSEWEPKERAKIFRFQQLLDNCTDLACIEVAITAITSCSDEFIYVLLDRNQLYKFWPPSEQQNVEFVWENNELGLIRLLRAEACPAR